MESIEDNECITWDGFEDALVGITMGIEPVAVYDHDKMVEVCMKRDEMSQEEALEYISFNATGGYLGPKTPIAIELDADRAAKQI
jgi:hypothetical protein